MNLSSDTVLDLMNHYGKKTGMKTEELVFIYAGKILHDKKEFKLSDLGIAESSTVVVVGRLRGGKMMKIKIKSKTKYTNLKLTIKRPSIRLNNSYPKL